MSSSYRLTSWTVSRPTCVPWVPAQTAPLQASPKGPGRGGDILSSESSQAGVPDQLRASVSPNVKWRGHDGGLNERLHAWPSAWQACPSVD